MQERKANEYYGEEELRQNKQVLRRKPLTHLWQDESCHDSPCAQTAKHNAVAERAKPQLATGQ